MKLLGTTGVDRAGRGSGDDFLDLSYRPPFPSALVALLLSLALHAGLLLVFRHAVVAGFHDPIPIRVRIFEPIAPPPPPPAPPAGAVPAADVPPLARPVPERPKEPPRSEKPAVRARPVKKPQPKPEFVKQIESSPPEAPAGPAVTVPGGQAGGVPGGVAGGVSGGVFGGLPGGTGDRVWPARQVATAPIVLERSAPRYPPIARARGVEGLVVLEVVVDRSGRIEKDRIAVVESVPTLDEAAIAAVADWRFRPGRDASGEAVRVLLQVPIRFRLR